MNKRRWRPLDFWRNSLKYLNEFRDRRLAEAVVSRIAEISLGRLTLMEVCGTHTVSILRSGIKELLSDETNLISGPGCPVCVTSSQDLDKAIAMARLQDVIVASFGDMMKVPGTSSSLQKERADGRDIRVVYSAMDSLKIANANLDKKVVLLAIGFETTAPTIAASILEAWKQGLENFLILCVHKLIPPAMKALLDMGEINIDGFICPGHVSSIIGSKPYQFIAEEYRIPCVITGFEPLDVLQAIYMLILQRREGRSGVEIQYSRAVPEEGNPTAFKLLDEVFEICDAQWRGLGILPKSGLKLRGKYQAFDALENLQLQVEESHEPQGCICAEILRGIKGPFECRLFGGRCNPENPIGPCMVSSEGTCAAYYTYNPRSE
jgi:hydrogenase expression/formation protein HypD